MILNSEALLGYSVKKKKSACLVLFPRHPDLLCMCKSLLFPCVEVITLYFLLCILTYSS